MNSEYKIIEYKSAMKKERMNNCTNIIDHFKDQIIYAQREYAIMKALYGESESESESESDESESDKLICSQEISEDKIFLRKLKKYNNNKIKILESKINEIYDDKV